MTNKETNERKKKLFNMARDFVRSDSYDFAIGSINHILTEFEEVKGDICGHCANWRCDDPLHMVGHCIAYRDYNVFHGRMCNPPCTKFER